MEAHVLSGRFNFFDKSARWVRAHPYSAIAVILFVALAVPFYLRTTSEWDDVFVRAARNMWYGRDIYQGENGYLYPPFMAWLSLPFVALPAHLERMLFYGINVLCTIVLCRCAWTISGGGRLQGLAVAKAEHVIFLLGLACGFRYVLDAFAHQQVDVVIGGLVLGGCLALSRSRHWTAATLFGLAAAMKCTALLWCPYLLWRRRWLPAAWLVTVAVAANLLPDLGTASPDGRLWGGQWLERYILPLPHAAPGTWGSDIIFNQSVSGLGSRYFLTAWIWGENGFAIIGQGKPLPLAVVKGIIYGGEALLILAGLLACGRRPQAPLDPSYSADTRENDKEEPRCRPPHQALEFSLILMLMLLLSPMSSKPHFCVLLLPAFCVARQAVMTKNRISAILLELAIIAGLLSVRGIWGEALSVYALWWGSITWSTLCLFAACCRG